VEWEKKVARFVSCDLWNDKHALVSKAIAMFLQKAWGICNAYNIPYISMVLLLLMFSSPPLRGAGLMALMLPRSRMATYIYLMMKGAAACLQINKLLEGLFNAVPVCMFLHAVCALVK
jgi:hypothetical protein